MKFALGLALVVGLALSCKKSRRVPRWTGIPREPSSCSWHDHQATCIEEGVAYFCIQGNYGDGCNRHNADIACAPAAVHPRQADPPQEVHPIPNPPTVTY